VLNIRKVDMYECEVCSKLYDWDLNAIECEKQGKEPLLAEVGDEIYYKVVMSGGFEPFFVPVRIGGVESRGHYHVYHLEDYNPDEDEWEVSNYCSTILGNDEFREFCSFE